MRLALHMQSAPADPDATADSCHARRRPPHSDSVWQQRYDALNDALDEAELARAAAPKCGRASRRVLLLHNRLQQYEVELQGEAGAAGDVQQ